MPTSTSIPALSTFLATLVIVIAVIHWWRAALVIASALLVAVLVTGVQEVVNRIDQRPGMEILTQLPVDSSAEDEVPRGSTAE